MKTTIILLIVTIGVFQTQAQKNKDEPKSEFYYQQKGNKQKTAGWVYLVSGSYFTITGIANIVEKDDNF